MSQAISLAKKDFITISHRDIYVVARKQDGYVSMTEFCKIFDAVFYDISQTDVWKSYVEGFKEEYPKIEPSYIINSGFPPCTERYKGTFLHPKLLHFVATALDPSIGFIINDVIVPKIYKELKKNASISISDKCKEIKELSQNDRAVIGKEGEKLVFDLFKPYLPSLLSCRNSGHACDMYDPVNNIRIEIKTKKRVHPVDYQQIKLADEIRRPKLTILISNVDKIRPRLDLFPNILSLYIDDIQYNMNFWMDFILNSEWERSEDIIERTRGDRFDRIACRMDDLLRKLDRNADAIKDFEPTKPKEVDRS